MVTAKANRSDITYVSGKEVLLDQIEPVWVELNKHMAQIATDFKQHFESMTFQRRKQQLLQKAKDGEMHIDLALDGQTDKVVGYCVSTVDDAKVGEVESICVLQAYRRSGIGSRLMSSALAWIDMLGASKKIVAVSAGNEVAFGFYALFGFHVRKTVLEQI
jgi:diamine N-acetyltransferase